MELLSGHPRKRAIGSSVDPWTLLHLIPNTRAKAGLIDRQWINGGDQRMINTKESRMVFTSAPADGPEWVREHFRNAMASLGSAVTIVTTDGDGGRAGFTATAVCSVTDTPPTVLVCLNRCSSSFEALQRNRVYCVNILSECHHGLTAIFGGKTPEAERFSTGGWSPMGSMAPALDDALVNLHCRVVTTLSVGTHDILLGAVNDIRLRGGMTVSSISLGVTIVSP
jgi:flavin reductase